MKITEEAMILFTNSGRKTVFTPNSLPQRDPVRKIKKLKTKRVDLTAECSNKNSAPNLARKILQSRLPCANFTVSV